MLTLHILVKQVGKQVAVETAPPVSSTSSSPSWPANTVINKIDLVEFAGTEYYLIEFNNAASGDLIAGSGTITLEFSSPAYGQPGETVLSFIAQPGERASLDLGQLKELTNTTLGGRGTFPNGPDVLAINVYKTAGTDVNANVILDGPGLGRRYYNLLYNADYQLEILQRVMYCHQI